MAQAELTNTALKHEAQLDRLVGALTPLPPGQCEIFNHFATGIYMREMRLPADSVGVGFVHKTEHFTIVSQGAAIVKTAEGVMAVRAPCTFKSPIGSRRAIFATEDLVWTTVHHNPDNITDMAILVPLLVEAEAEYLIGGKKSVQAIAHVALEGE